MKVLLVMGSGGHTSQMLKLKMLLGNRYSFEYLVNKNDALTPTKIQGKIHRIPNPRGVNANFFINVINTLQGIFIALRLVNRFDAVISTGPGLSVPVFYVAKLMRKKTIFIESWSRAHSKSVSGRLCYPVSDLFFVQWHEMKKLYPKAVYAGRLA